MIHQLKLESLKDLDAGKAVIAFERHLTRAANDCADRPGDRKPRKVILEINLTPVLDEDLDCTEVKAQIQVTSKVPVHRTKVYSLGMRRNGILVFNEDSPEAIDQTTLLPDDDGEA